MAPLVTEKAQATNQALGADVSQDYKTFKAATLDQQSLIKNAYHHKFQLEGWDLSTQTLGHGREVKRLVHPLAKPGLLVNDVDCGTSNIRTVLHHPPSKSPQLGVSPLDGQLGTSHPES